MSELGEKEAEFDNPMADAFDVEGAPGSPGKAADDQSFADLDHDLTDDELSDLTFAFQAMDRDGSGTIEPPELHAMMSVMGADITEAAVKELFRECKVEFQAWLKTHDQDAALPEYMEHTTDEAGGGQTKHGGQRHNVELQIDSGNKQHPVFSRLKKAGQNPMIAYTVGAPITASNKLLSISYNMVRDTSGQLADGLLGGSKEGAWPRCTMRGEQLCSATALLHAPRRLRPLTHRSWLTAQPWRQRRLRCTS